MNSIILTLWISIISWIEPPNFEHNKSNSCKTVNGYVAATSEKYLDAAISYTNDKDFKAFKSLIDAGAIIIMKGGIKVHLVETHIFAGKVEFRVDGSTIVLWAPTEGIKCRW